MFDFFTIMNSFSIGLGVYVGKTMQKPIPSKKYLVKKILLPFLPLLIALVSFSQKDEFVSIMVSSAFCFLAYLSMIGFEFLLLYMGNKKIYCKRK